MCDVKGAPFKDLGPIAIISTSVLKVDEAWNVLLCSNCYWPTTGSQHTVDDIWVQNVLCYVCVYMDINNIYRTTYLNDRKSYVKARQFWRTTTVNAYIQNIFEACYLNMSLVIRIHENVIIKRAFLCTWL